MIAGYSWMLVSVGWIARLHKYKNIVQNCRILPKITQVLRARPTQSMAHSTIAITLPLIVSRKGRLTQPSPSPLPLFYSL